MLNVNTKEARRLGKSLENCLNNQPTTGPPLIANTEVHCNDTTLNDAHIRRHVRHKHVTGGMRNGKGNLAVHQDALRVTPHA
jgi:hypothetical protein